MSKIKNKQILVNSSFDFNSNKLINLGAPENPNDAVRLTDLQTIETSLENAIIAVDAGSIIENITSLETAINKGDNSLESEINDLVSDIETGFTSLETQIISGFTSLDIALETEISNRISGDDSLEDAITGNNSSLDTALEAEISNRISGDDSLETGIVTIEGSLDTALESEISNRISGDDSLEDAISGNNSSLDTALETEISNRISGDDSLETGIVTIEGSLDTALEAEISNRISGDESLETGIINQIDTHTHYQLHQPDGTNPFVYTDNAGVLHIDGDIVQSGTTYETHAEEFYTTKDIIITRDGAIAGLSAGEYTGIRAKLYDGVNDGYLVFDSGGTARVGDEGDLQPLTTRIETPTDGYYAFWDAANNRLDFNEIDVSGDIQAAAGSGLTYEVADGTLNVATDDETIKVVNDELRSTKFVTESDSTTTIVSGTTNEATNLTLTYIPVGDITVTVNGVEYLVSAASNASQTDKPFFFATYPVTTAGVTLRYNATEAGFGLDTDDLIVVKYNYVDVA